jgi:uncharacterized glyoxalase superfamily protein PhnB
MSTQTMTARDRWGMLLDPFGLKWGIDEPAA